MKFEKYILNEGSRDNLLLPYINILHEYGIKPSIGQFKSKLLNKLGFEGGITNLSNRSNYYLVGCARYYFDGQLTLNKDLSLLKPETWQNGSDVQDEWNQPVCQKLNFLINILRDAYIDSVGTQLLEPEDFGTLPIKKLLTKYNKQIKKAMGVIENGLETQNLSNDPTVSGGKYTFEIIYSIDECRKYKQPTAPGSWCISYSEGNYNYYMRKLNIHYVIFRMNGWEKIQRPQNPLESEGFTPQKPHDLYGNSLIAVLQSNTSPEPVFITSRWNHGYEVACEADHAYTKEEFQKITGTSDDDLKRIYEIWKIHSGKQNKNVLNKNLLNEIRKAKYAQMRINSGENPEEILSVVNTIVGEEGSKIKKSVTVCKIKSENERDISNAAFLVDRGNIVFSSALFNYHDNSSFVVLNNIIFEKLDGEKRNLIYCYKTHKVVEVEGVTVFKYTPVSDSEYSYVKNIQKLRFCEIKQAREQTALINLETGNPVKLPNGSSWANAIYLPNRWTHTHAAKINCRIFGDNDRMFEIVFDLSSREKYFYDSYRNLFINLPINTSLFDLEYSSLILSDEEARKTEPTIDNTSYYFRNNNNIIPIAYISHANGWTRRTAYQYLYDIDKQKKVIFGDKETFPKNIQEISKNLINYPITSKKNVCLYLNDYTALGLNNQPILFDSREIVYNENKENFILFKIYQFGENYSVIEKFYIYDLINDSFLMSPFDNTCLFILASREFADNRIHIVKKVDLNNVDGYGSQKADASFEISNPYDIKPNNYKIPGSIPAQHIIPNFNDMLAIARTIS